MSLKTKAFIYQLLSFAVLFIAARYIIAVYTHLNGIWIPLTAFVVSTIVAPQFKALQTRDGEAIFMKWIFLKGVRKL